MAKRFKLRLSRVISSFQICRSKNASEIPIPAIYRVSPINRKALDINYPKQPDPPSTPDFQNHLSRKKASVGCRRQARILAQYLADCSFESLDFAWEKEAYKQRPTRLHRYMRSISLSDESNGNISPVIVAASQKNKNKENSKDSNKDEIGVSREHGGCSFSGEDDENEVETETLLLSSRSFSYDSSYDYCHPVVYTTTKKTDNGNKKSNKMRIQKLKRQVSKNWKLSSPEITSPMGASVLRRMVSCKADGKVKESVPVVKKSEDPYEDFKRSMLEMILEKQMFEAKDLEELLQCFLSLNSRQYHGAIVEAFRRFGRSCSVILLQRSEIP
ncbi:hypothetical protein GH714_005948 [Hevea brasiliensis]|uniref:Transcription repressor n=1 Tax=Hevea brasiliensis TaxID=3981 RepID=A0A6A6LFY1_HEVBR|nr:hypothetical protein GH714_005948 [Hevea brasiliensis]